MPKHHNTIQQCTTYWLKFYSIDSIRNEGARLWSTGKSIFSLHSRCLTNFCRDERRISTERQANKSWSGKWSLGCWTGRKTHAETHQGRRLASLFVKSQSSGSLVAPRGDQSVCFASTWLDLNKAKVDISTWKSSIRHATGYRICRYFDSLRFNRLSLATENGQKTNDHAKPRCIDHCRKRAIRPWLANGTDRCHRERTSNIKKSSRSSTSSITAFGLDHLTERNCENAGHNQISWRHKLTTYRWWWLLKGQGNNQIMPTINQKRLF